MTGKEGERKHKAWPLLKEFWGWMRPHQRYVWMVLLLLILSTPLSLISPLIIRRVVDDAVERSSRDDVFLWGSVLVGLTLLGVLFGLAIGYLNTLFHAKVLRDIRLKLYLHMQRLSYRYYGEKETGWLMSRQTDDVGSLTSIMADAFARAAVDVVRAVGFVIMLFYVEWRMASAGLGLVAVIFGFEYLISGKLRARNRIVRESWTEVSRTLHQGLSGHALVRATGSERREAIHFARALHKNVRAVVSEGLFSLLTNHIFGLIAGVAPTLIILGGVWLIVTSNFTVGGLFAFFIYLTQLFGAVASVAGMNPRIQRSLASLERIREVLDTEPEVESSERGIRPEALTGSVTLEAVSFSYEKNRPVLQDLDLVIPARSMVALVGPSGAGKTTLAHLLPRFFDPTAGRILIDGVDLRRLDLAWYRRHVGLVPQEIFLFDRTLRENITYGCGLLDGADGVTPEQLEAAASAANALEFISAMPEGFDTVVGERGVKLSGGQRQRIAIAREILRDPTILILDEATSSLDSRTETLIQEALATLLSGRTSVVIAHRLSTVIRADKIVVLEGGRVVETGRHAELLARGGLYAELYESQFRHATQERETP